MKTRLGAILCGTAIMAMVRTAPGEDVRAPETQTRPGPPPGTYSITPTAESIRIPFELFEGEIRLVGRIKGKEVRILVDNGALWDDLLFFGSPRVDALGLRRAGKILVAGAGSGDPFEADMASGISISFAGEGDRVIEFRDQSAIITPHDPAKLGSWEGAEGQISAALFKNFVVGFDFDEGVMTLVAPKAFDPEGQGTELPLKPLAGSASWAIPGVIALHDGRRLVVDMAIDLGWDEPLAINAGQAHDIRVPEGLTKTRLGRGAQGDIHGYLGTVRCLQIGAFRLPNATATYSTVEDGGAKDDEILVGLGTFARFHVHFDYPGHRLFLKPNRKFREPFAAPEPR